MASGRGCAFFELFYLFIYFMRRCHKHVGGRERKNPGEKEFENNRGGKLLDKVIRRRQVKISNMLASVGLLDLWVPCFVSLA